MANSSALRLADLGLVWSNVTCDADFEIIDLDLASDRGLLTAIVLSLFLDRRAEDDDVPPSGDPRDRRGWWADEFSDVAGDRYGSRLWLIDRSALSNETVLRAKQYAAEALAWLLEDKVASAIDLVVTRSGNALLIAGELARPGRDAVSFRFAHTWNHLQEDL